MSSKDDILKNGGKGSGLTWLTQNTDIGYSVPEFDIIDTSYHEDFLKQPGLAQIAAMLHNKANPEDDYVDVYQSPKRLDEICKELTEKFQGRSVAVRSSAVVSEDNDSLTGAGIYDTFFLESWQLNPESLTDAVLKVYNSVNSDKAVEYRTNAGLDDERMAVVVQELSDDVGFVNGVMQSRLQAVSKIIPISWSEEIGAVVEGVESSKITTAHFGRTQRYGYTDYKRIYTSGGDLSVGDIVKIDDLMISVILGLKKRYGKDFEAEFSANLEKGILNMLQIRPLTNIVDKKITFPNKKPIFTTGYKGCCIGVGEYIGPMVFEDDVKEGWEEPAHYAFVAPSLGKFIEEILPNLRTDYDALTPNKRAMVLTHGMSFGSHALTIAQERNILCIGKYQDFTKPYFTKSLKNISPNIHIVSDGLVGRVYEATEQEAKEFERRHLEIEK